MQDRAAHSVKLRYFRPPKTGTDILKIGFLQRDYGLQRASYHLDHPAYVHFQVFTAPLSRLDRNSNYFTQRPLILSRGFDLYHCWNNIPFNKPFVTSVEMEFPRLFGNISPQRWRKTYDRLKNSDCRGIWPLSDAALRYVQRRFDLAGHNDLTSLLRVFRGSISPRLSAQSERPQPSDDYPLHILFVGGDGFRKGLFPLINACNRLVKHGANLKLTVVGTFTCGSYIAPGINFDHTDVERIVANSDWVTMISRLNNDGVRTLMDSHHLLAFPTFDESLGWVPMEAAMSKMPTIGTNVFAIPEFVIDGRTGWSIELDLDEDGRWRHVGLSSAAVEIPKVERAIEDNLVLIIQSILNQPKTLTERGAAAYDLVMDRYDPKKAAAELAQLYRAAL